MTTTYLSNPNIYGEVDPEGEIIRKKFEQFLHEFEDTVPATGHTYKPYYHEAENMKINKRTTININFKHLLSRDELYLI